MVWVGQTVFSLPLYIPTRSSLREAQVMAHQRLVSQPVRSQILTRANCTVDPSPLTGNVELSLHDDGLFPYFAASAPIGSTSVARQDANAAQTFFVDAFNINDDWPDINATAMQMPYELSG